MAALTGYNKMFAGQTTDVDTVKNHNFGARAFDADGNEYIYLKGVSGNAAGYWVTFDEDHVTTLATASAVGRVAISMAALDATTDFGWYQIYGKNTIAIAGGAITIDKQLYLTSSAGRVDDADVTKDLIKGAICRLAAGAAGSAFTVEITYPFVNNEKDN